MPKIIKNGRVYGAAPSSNVWEGTQAQYDAIENKDPNITYYITDGAVEPIPATNIEYDNSLSGLSATQVQSAVDEVGGYSTGSGTWETTNVTGNMLRWEKVGHIVCCYLEFTPKSGKIANGNVICSGLPIPKRGSNTVVLGGNTQQMMVNGQGTLHFYFPTDTTTLNRFDINFTYVS